ncbi:MAG TPA: glycine cleavage system aminomethyltransferase GcvT [Herpetosiphonaceae bacterium]
MAAVDPLVSDLIRWEEQQQLRKLILVASVSAAPRAVLQALGSVFQNVCAEGYPSKRMAQDAPERLADLSWQLAYARRYADRRFYKGVDYVNIVESLAQRRCAELFAHGSIRPQDIFVNVQSLAGAAANLATYQALLQPGDTLMAMNLYQGGHLTHGSEFNVSGKRYRTVSYTVDESTERLDYAAIRELALASRPRLIVGGYTSYPWAPDWHALRAIADEVGAYLMADIAHTAGLVVAGAYPNPVGLADVTVFTPNKTLCGPRGAVVMTTDPDLAGAIDLAVFPGEQGAPHANKFAAMAVAFGIARSEAFHRMQHQIVRNAARLATALQRHGLRLVYGGTDTHLLLIDLKSVPSTTGFPLWGEAAARILDLAGIVVNKNTIPGDTQTALATGLRFGTTWITQQGLVEQDMDTIAELIRRVLYQIRPFAYDGLIQVLPRGKIDLDVLESVQHDVARLTERFAADTPDASAPRPHDPAPPHSLAAKPVVLRVTGWRARQFMDGVCTRSLARLEPSQPERAYLLDSHGCLIDQVVVAREPRDAIGRDRYLLVPSPQRVERVIAWLRGLADGYICFDQQDLLRKIAGPVDIEIVDLDTLQSRDLRDGTLTDQAAAWPGIAHPAHARELHALNPQGFDLGKPYFVGQHHLERPVSLLDKPGWSWSEADGPLRQTPLYDLHRSSGAKMVPFSGWEMPVWYTSVVEEHRAVRSTAGLFDVSHMGVFQIEGPYATEFLDTVFTNYAAWLDDGESCYGFLLDPDGQVLDDAIIYRCHAEQYVMVVNAGCTRKDWRWLNLVNEGRVAIDARRLWVQTQAPAILRDLTDAAAGALQRRDLALQGPASLAALQAVADDPATSVALARLQRNRLIGCTLAGVDVLVARTGYTGERYGYELLAHPDALPHLWQTLRVIGQPFGVVPVGLAARDSTRTEAGLPLYGHELAGPLKISPIEAGLGAHVKYHKPFFIGRDALLARMQQQTRRLICFRVERRGVRRPQFGDPIVVGNVVVGQVTSCSIDGERYLVGQALVEQPYTTPGAQIGILPLGDRPLAEKQAWSVERASPVEARVLPRFLQPKGTRAAHADARVSQYRLSEAGQGAD